MLASRSLARLARAQTTRQVVSARSIVPKLDQLTLTSTTRTAAARCFSVSASRCGRGTVDRELSAKLESEYSLETTSNEAKSPPEAIQEFLKNGPFTVTDVEGNDEVILERQFGNETIRISFAVSNINLEDTENGSFEQEGEEDSAVVEEDISENEGDEPGYPVNCQITIQKDGTDSVLSLDATTQDGIFLIERMTLYPSVELATGNSAEYHWRRGEKYLGPEFSTLDEDLQGLMDRFLEERGINTSLALFVPDYVDYKENREYVNWLQGVKKFIDI